MRAELTWAQKTVELHANPKTAVLEARFRFTNTGATPLDITRIQSSCGCTAAELEQRHYASGESGEIVARFTVGERVGLQTKTLLVAASDSRTPTTLTLIVHIPERVHLRPAFVTWTLGDPATEKTVEIEAAPDTPPLQDVSAESSSPGLTAQLQSVAEGRKYQVTLTPRATKQPFFATVTIRCRLDGEEKTFHAYGMVRQSPPAPGDSPHGSGP